MCVDAICISVYNTLTLLHIYLYEKLIKPNGLSLLISFALIPTGNGV